VADLVRVVRAAQVGRRRGRTMNGRAWSDAELVLLRELYPDLRAIDVAEQLGRAVNTVHAKASQLGLKKSDSFKASDLSGRVAQGRQNEAMIATRFQKGQPSWSKGTKGLVGVQDGCRATQFKSGRLAHESRNYVPLGSYRLSKDGYLERKVTDDPSIFPARRWVAVHRLVWIEAHGPIQAGHVVVFLPGRRTTVLEAITLDGLELVSRQELMRRNTLHNRYPKEIVHLVQLQGAIKRQANRIAREQQP
jgi:hypothetical protein